MATGHQGDDGRQAPGRRASGAGAGARGRARESGLRGEEAASAVSLRGRTLIVRLDAVRKRPTRTVSTARAVATHQRHNANGLCRMGCGRPLHLYKHRCDRCQIQEHRRKQKRADLLRRRSA